jgi:hypothetical protein
MHAGLSFEDYDIETLVRMAEAERETEKQRQFNLRQAKKKEKLRT